MFISHSGDWILKSCNLKGLIFKTNEIPQNHIDRHQLRSKSVSQPLLHTKPHQWNLETASHQFATAITHAKNVLNVGYITCLDWITGIETQ